MNTTLGSLWNRPRLIAGLLAGLGALISSGIQAETTVAVERGPYLQLGTESGITLRWRTDLATSSRVDFGLAPESLSWSEENPESTTEHELRLEGLSPGTRYYYAIGDASGILAGGDADHYFTTAPIPGTAQPTRIWVLGDSGTGDATAASVRDAYYDLAGPESTDLWLMLGDNAYPRGTDAEYQAAVFDMYPEMLRRAVVWPTLGNHDAQSSDSPTQSGPYYEIFTLPDAGQAGGVSSGTEAYYSFDHANIHFVVLDSHDTSRWPGSPMLTWLEQDLAATARDWVIAFWHHPPYSKGSHDSDDETRLIQMREFVVPILEDYGVDLVLAGHSHSYERSYLMDGHYGRSWSLTPDMILDDGDGKAGGDGVYWKPIVGPEPHEGAVYTVAGCSGYTSPAPLDHPAMYVSLETLGSVVLEVDGVRLDAKFLDAAGAIRDEFSIVKGCSDSGQVFSSLNPDEGNLSRVFTPGLCDAGPPCASDIGSSVSSSLLGAFWRPGEGDPAVGLGTDNGSYEPLEAGNSGWVRTDPGQAAHIQGAWSADNGVDGCIGIHDGTDCMTLVLADQHEAMGYFVALSAEADSGGDYYFDRPGGAPITLSLTPAPDITGSRTINSYTLEFDVLLDEVGEGLYPDAACGSDLVAGYRVYEYQVERDGPAPTDRSIDAGWILTEGGELPSGEPIPLGTQTTLTYTCYTAIDIYLASTLVFESGFELPLVSRQPTYVLCGFCLVDDDSDGGCVQWVWGPGGECDDANPDVYPGAPQICGDGLNNDCEHPEWPSTTGTNEHDGDEDGFTECDGDCDDADPGIHGTPADEAREVVFASDKTTLAWTPPDDPGNGTFVYDLVRSLQPSDFHGAAVCLVANGASTQAQDLEQPSPGAGFYYLIRPENACGEGPLGSRSDGSPRAARSCP